MTQRDSAWRRGKSVLRQPPIGLPIKPRIEPLVGLLIAMLLLPSQLWGAGVRVPQLDPSFASHLSKLQIEVAALGTPSTAEEGDAGKGVSATHNSRLNAIVIATQELLEEALERSILLPANDVPRQYKTYLDAHHVICDWLHSERSRFTIPYRQEFAAAARAQLVQASATHNVAALERVAQRYPLTQSATHAALRAAQLHLEAGSTHRATRALGWIRLDQLPPVTDAELQAEELPEFAQRAEVIQLGLELAALSGDVEAFTHYQGYLDKPVHKNNPLVATLTDRLARMRVDPLPRFTLRAKSWVRQWPSDGHTNLTPSSLSARRAANFTPVASIESGVVTVPTPRALKRFRLADGVALRSSPFPGDHRYSERARSWRHSLDANAEFCITTFVDKLDKQKGRGSGGAVVRAEVPHRALVMHAYSEQRQKLTPLWYSSKSDNPLIRELSFSSSPLLVGNRLYALGWRESGYVTAYLVAFDAASGDVLWSTLVASNQIELTRFGELAEEPRLGGAVLRHGTLYVSTNLGLVAALEVSSGRIEWANAYSPARIAQSISTRRRRRYPFESECHWDQTHFIFHGNRLIVTPQDSYTIFAFDLESGRVVQRRNVAKGNQPNFILGVVNNEMVLCNKFELARLPLDNLTAAVRSKRLEGFVNARPALIQGGIVYTSAKGIYFSSYDARSKPLLLHAFAYPVNRRNRPLNTPMEGQVLIQGRQIVVVNKQRATCYRLSLVH